MSKEHWDQTLKYLYDRRLHLFTATLLEAAGPLTVLGAQLIYVSQPVLTLLIPQRQTQQFAGILEDPVKSKSFIRALRSYKPAS